MCSLFSCTGMVPLYMSNHQIASLLKIRFLDEEVANNHYPQKMGRVDAFPSQSKDRKETVIPWADMFEKGDSPGPGEALIQKEGKANEEDSFTEPKYREYICGEEALRISPSEPYVLRRPIRRGHLNISLHYPVQQGIACYSLS
ncbi:actin-related protein 9-like isoform X1 [Primulina huaijiensis]|uniref:actin-related protein 9-like isoform X1 n=1 Tax=Primulina huaijiensis TaxID=1492673 RepID=UPI003CC77758